MHPDGILFGGEGRDQITNAGVRRAESRGFVFVSPFCVGGMALRVERFIEGRNGFMYAQNFCFSSRLVRARTVGWEKVL